MEGDIGGVHIRETFYVLYPGFLYDWYKKKLFVTDIIKIIEFLIDKYFIICCVWTLVGMFFNSLHFYDGYQLCSSSC